MPSPASPLVDSHGRKMGRLRISVTPRCNFACVYCRPEEMGDFPPAGDLLTFEEIERVARVAVGLGMSRIRLTGGEPLVRPGIEELVGRVKAIEGVTELTLTTNASLLDRLAEPLKRAGLDRVNISLDTLSRETARRIARVDAHSSVLRGIDAAVAAGLTPLRLNAVVMAGINDEELPDLVRFAHARGATMRFIEYMPMGEARFAEENRVVPVRVMRERLARAGFDLQLAVTDASEPSRNWVCRNSGAKVGFISSMTEHFCSTCDRMRLTAEGALRPCLHQDYEVDVRHALRSSRDDAAIHAAFAQAARGKWEGHHMNRFVPLYSRREMITLGG